MDHRDRSETEQNHKFLFFKLCTCEISSSDKSLFFFMVGVRSGGRSDSECTRALNELSGRTRILDGRGISL